MSVFESKWLAQAQELQMPDQATAKTDKRGTEEADWPSECLDYERRFGQPHARLFPLIGKRVTTPRGDGMLLQVFSSQVTVALDRRPGAVVDIVPPEDVRPIQ